ncbi:HNH endonuclease [anaerobic digester metagenome]
MVLVDFQNWMSTHTSLSDSSIYKYTRGVNTISKEMLELSIIKKDLLAMNLVELDLFIVKILNNEQFITKNTKGNKMYSNSLKQYRLFAIDTFEDYEPFDKLIDDIQCSNIDTTEKESIIKSRVGQGQYRKNLIDKYDGTCIVTGINYEKLLVASHIKPWSICNNHERIDTENGLLLSANMDKLFDNGLITFSNGGKMYVSSLVGNANEQRLHIDHTITVNLKSAGRMLEYLEFHRDVLFVK